MTNKGQMAGQLTASTFNCLVDQYASSLSNMAYSYAELAVSSLAVAKTIASIYCTYQ